MKRIYEKELNTDDDNGDYVYTTALDIAYRLLTKMLDFLFSRHNVIVQT